MVLFEAITGLNVTHECHRIGTRVDPVMFIPNDLHSAEPVVVHQRTKSSANPALLIRSHRGTRVSWVTVLWLVLYADGKDGEPLGLESLQAFK